MERTVYTATFQKLRLYITERILEIMKNFIELRIKNFCKKTIPWTWTVQKVKEKGNYC